MPRGRTTTSRQSVVGISLGQGVGCPAEEEDPTLAIRAAKKKKPESIFFLAHSLNPRNPRGSAVALAK